MDRDIEVINADIQEFIKTIEGCKGAVYLENSEGDRFNLKSKLSQIIGLTKLITGGIITDAILRCELPEDETKLVRFNLFREVPNKND